MESGQSGVSVSLGLGAFVGGGVTMIFPEGTTAPPGVMVGVVPGATGAGVVPAATVNWSTTRITPTVSAVRVRALVLASSLGTIPVRIATPPAWTSISNVELVRVLSQWSRL